MSLKPFDPNTYPFFGHPERITLHWTGGSYTPSSLDAEHYQFLIDGAGKAWCGLYTIEDQDDTSNGYAAHTASFNTKNIGISLCGMAGAQENGTFGDYPINEFQWNTAIQLCAFLLRQYKIKVSQYTLASHCEIEMIHGVPQSGKWDVSAVPFRDETWEALNDLFRQDVARSMEEDVWPVEKMDDDVMLVMVPVGSIVDVVIGVNPPVRVQ